MRATKKWKYRILRWKYTILFTPLIVLLVAVAVWWQISLLRLVLG